MILENEAFCLQPEAGIRDGHVTGVQTCALPISMPVRSTDSDETPATPPPTANAAHSASIAAAKPSTRSEERRVGKECRSRRSAYHEKNKIERVRPMSGKWPVTVSSL